MMNLDLLSFIGSASNRVKLRRIKDDDQVLNAPCLVPYWSQVWLTYLILEIFNRAVSSLMDELVFKLSMFFIRSLEAGLFHAGGRLYWILVGCLV